MTALVEEINKALDGKRVKDLAAEWGLPRWVLDDLRNDRLKVPGGRYLVPLARGLKRPVEEIIDLANRSPQEALP